MERIVKYMIIVLVSFHINVHAEDEIFYGGSISYKLEEIAGKKIANIELITGWKLGKGPCGDTCKEQSVNTLTNVQRDQEEQTAGNINCFGNFSSSYKTNANEDTITRDLNDIVHNNYTERVIAVSDHAKWEQELMSFSIDMANEEEDVVFEGSYWRHLIYGGKTAWHILSKLDSRIRSDTNRLNNCPQVLTKPFYRVRLHQTTTIRIPMIDPDGDIVRCEISQFGEKGKLPQPPGVHVHKEIESTVCRVSINTSKTLGYKDDTWVVIPVTFRDYNKKKIMFGSEVKPPAKYQLSSTGVQFAVQVLGNLVTPEFVPPTMKGDHLFIVYVDTTWTTDIYAKATPNTTIYRFIQSGRNRENVTLSSLCKDTTRERVAYTTMLWEPSSNDIGQHILCARVVDDTGVDSDELRCYTLEVRADTFNHSTTSKTGKPYFIDIPSPSQFVNCKIGATCLIPVYVKSSVNIKTITVVNSYVDETILGQPHEVVHKGENIFKAILSFTHTMPGVHKICLTATDVNNVTSDTVCFNSEIEPPDPCLSSPCRNSATCKYKKKEGIFICECVSDQFYGQLCEYRKDPCKPNSCLEGRFRSKLSYNGKCYCTCKTGFTGDHCEENIDDCKNNTCDLNKGTCRDLVENFTCDCYQRYGGRNCDVDHCQNETSDVTVCPADGCSQDSCSVHGICTNGGHCICQLGYSSHQDCSESDGNLSSVIGLKFVPPSPMDKSTFTCFIASNDITPCELLVFIATATGNKPALAIKTSDDISKNTTVENLKASILQGVNNVFSALILIRGSVQSKLGQYICVTATEGSLDDNICLHLTFTNAPKHDSSQKNATTKFIEPTQVEGSTLTGYVGDTYTVLLFTTYMSPCENVISTTKNVSVFPTYTDGIKACVTEASFVIQTKGPSDICFQSAKKQFQKRCFIAVGRPRGSDPCGNHTCQNDGQCFPQHTTPGYQCICNANYIGKECQEGPCPVNDCKNGAYCKINNRKEICICKAGYTGIKCDEANSNNSHQMSFIYAAKPNEFDCVLYQSCSLALMISGGQTKPKVSAGYVSPKLLLNDIQVLDRHMPGTYQININLVPKETGLKDLCIQSLDNAGINKDELCCKVNVITDLSSIYGYKDRPHFVSPSLPNNSQVECQEDEPCHVLYEITVGEGNNKECVTLTPKDNKGISTYYIYTSCESCIPGQSHFGNCSVDISVQPEFNISNAQDATESKMLCVSLSLTGKSVVGESRCFKFIVRSKAKGEEKKGCQLIECKNGGFCDGHIPSTPRCYCKKGYFGDKCDEEGGSLSLSSGPSQSFVGDLGIPSEIKCMVDQSCQIPFEVISNVGQQFKVSLGYADPRLSAHGPTYSATGNSNLVTIGSVKMNPSQTGTFKLCLQINVQSKTVSEMCISAKVSNATIEDIDLAKPHFIDPTILHQSTILCPKEKPCHLDLYSTNGDNFGAPGKCPSVSETNSADPMTIHIFSPEYQLQSCSNDVTYTAKETRMLCFQVSFPGKRGENRCFTIKAVTDLSNKVKSPCTGITCENGGKCILDFNSVPVKATCICAQGFDGDHCNLSLNKTTGLPGIGNFLNKTVVANQFFDIKAALPKHVNCDVLDPCCVVVPFHGDANKPPVLGFKDNDLSIISNGTFAADNSQNPLQYFQTCIKGPPGKNKRLCLQTTANDSQQRINVDEICIEVEFRNEGKGVSSTEPKFTGGLSDGSSFLCHPTSMCHIPVITDPKNENCEQVRECGDGLAGIYVFNTARIADKCVTDVAMKTSANENTKSLCISSGLGGEQKVINLITNKTNEFSPCQKKHCANGGRCMSTSKTEAVCECKPGYTSALCETAINPCANISCGNGGKCITNQKLSTAKATCICASGFSGDECKTAVKKTTNLQGVKDLPIIVSAAAHSFDSNSSVPKVVKCDEVNPCCIVIPFYGENSMPPLIGYSEVNISSSKVITNKPHQELKYFQTCIKGEPGIPKRMCVQTTNNGTKHGMNIDEICFEVKFESGGQKQSITSPTFTGSLTNGSSVLCQPDTTCHIPVFTNKTSETCEQVTECGASFEGAHVLETTEIDGGKCLTDVAIKTIDLENTKALCISAGQGGEERKITVETKLTTDYGPCQRKHCLNGGQCLSTSNKLAHCNCMTGFTGILCDNVSTTAAPMTTDSTTISTTITTASKTSTFTTKVSTTRELTNVLATGLQITTDIIAKASAIVITKSNLAKSVGTHHSSSNPVISKSSRVASSLHSVSTTKVSTTPAATTTVSTTPASATVTSAYNLAKNIASLQSSSKPVTSTPSTLGASSSRSVLVSTTAVPTTTDSATTVSTAETTTKKIKLHQSSTKPVTLKTSKSVINSSRTDYCDQVKAKEHAQNMVVAGHASCFCNVNGKKVYIIKKRPVPIKKNMVKAAGFGAGGMVGIMAIGVIIYAIKNGKRRQLDRKPAPRPRRLSRSRVSPEM